MIEVLFLIIILTGSSMIVLAGRAEIPFNAKEAVVGRETSKEVRRHRYLR